MGHKTHPIGFRLGVSKDWHSRWFAPSGKEYRQFVWEDLQIRSSILEQYPDASISKIDIVPYTQSRKEILLMSDRVTIPP